MFFKKKIILSFSAVFFILTGVYFCFESNCKSVQAVDELNKTNRLNINDNENNKLNKNNVENDNENINYVDLLDHPRYNVSKINGKLNLIFYDRCGVELNDKFNEFKDCFKIFRIISLDDNFNSFKKFIVEAYISDKKVFTKYVKADETLKYFDFKVNITDLKKLGLKKKDRPSFDNKVVFKILNDKNREVLAEFNSYLPYLNDDSLIKSKMFNFDNKTTDVTVKSLRNSECNIILKKNFLVAGVDCSNMDIKSGLDNLEKIYLKYFDPSNLNKVIAEKIVTKTKLSHTSENTYRKCEGKIYKNKGKAVLLNCFFKYKMNELKNKPNNYHVKVFDENGNYLGWFYHDVSFD